MRYSVGPENRLPNSLASLTRCASPPLSVNADWPRRIYPSPASWMTDSFEEMAGRSLKNATASSTVMDSTSEMECPLNITSSVSLLYRLPPHTSHGTYTSGRKSIDTFVDPAPPQASHRPPLTLKLKRPGLYPRIFASGSSAKRSRMCEKTPV